MCEASRACLAGLGFIAKASIASFSARGTKALLFLKKKKQKDFFILAPEVPEDPGFKGTKILRRFFQKATFVFTLQHDYR